MRTTLGIKDLETRLHLLVGKPVWAVPAGGCTGSIILVYFGDKVRRRQRCENPALPEEARSYEAELRLMVWCAWRIEAEGTGIVSGSGDFADETMLSGLTKLIGQTVTQIAVNPFLDLLVVFSGGMGLRLFCDRRTDDSDTEACYALFVREEEVCSVGNGIITLVQVETGVETGDAP